MANRIRFHWLRLNPICWLPVADTALKNTTNDQQRHYLKIQKQNGGTKTRVFQGCTRITPPPCCVAAAQSVTFFCRWKQQRKPVTLGRSLSTFSVSLDGAPSSARPRCIDGIVFPGLRNVEAAAAVQLKVVARQIGWPQTELEPTYHGEAINNLCFYNLHYIEEILQNVR